MFLKGVSTLQFNMASKSKATTSKVVDNNQDNKKRKKIKKDTIIDEGMELDLQHIPNVPISNKFHALSESDESGDEGSDTQPSQQHISTKTKIPPIVLYHFVEEHTKSFSALRTKLKEDFDLKYKGDRVIIKAKTRGDYDEIISNLNTSKLEFHTYTPDQDRELRLVLKNIPPNLSTDEIFADLKRLNLRPVKVTQMYKKMNDSNNTVRKYPMFIVVFEKGTSPQDVFKETKVCYCSIKWEKYKNFTGVTQCYNCQSFGHIAKNCNKTPKCVKCAGPHPTKECKKSLDTAPECTNCHGAHPASFRKCEAYARQLDIKLNRGRRQPSQTQDPPNLSTRDYPRLPKTSGEPSQQNAWPRTHVPDTQSHDEQPTGDISTGDIIREAKNIFCNINFKNIKTVLLKTITKIKQSNDSITKVAALLEGLMDLFVQDGS